MLRKLWDILTKRKVKGIKQLNSGIDADVWTAGALRIMGFLNEPHDWVYVEDRGSYYAVYKCVRYIHTDVFSQGHRKFFAEVKVLHHITHEMYPEWERLFKKHPYV